MIIELECICNYGSCPCGEGGDRDVNRIPGHIQLASESGMRAGIHAAAAEQSKKHQHTISWKYIGKKEGWNPQAPGPPTRWPGWHVVAQSSCDDHVTSEGVQVPDHEAMGVC